MEGIALTAASVMPQLLLQKPHQKSNVKEHIKCLERRMSTWLEGDINTLLLEGRVIQQRIRRRHTKDENETLAKSFTKLMQKGNVKSALRLYQRLKAPYYLLTNLLPLMMMEKLYLIYLGRSIHLLVT